MAHTQSVTREESLNAKPGRHNVVRDALVGLVASLGVGLTASALLILIVILFSHII